MDGDWIVQRYLVHSDRMGARAINHVMFIEEKSNGADLTFGQRDLMFILHQLFRWADRKYKRFKTVRGDWVRVRWWGYFKLRYSGATIEDSEFILWNKRQITLHELEQLLRFELNPRTLRPRSDRRHHASKTAILPLELRGGDDSWT